MSSIGKFASAASSCSSFVCPAAGTDAGPLHIGTHEASRWGSDRTSSRVTSPPIECPTRWTGRSGENQSATARTTSAIVRAVWLPRGPSPGKPPCPGRSMDATRQPKPASGSRTPM